MAVDRAIGRVRHSDPDAARHRERVTREKLSACRRVAQRIADEGVLAGSWTVASATDMLFAISTSDVVEALIGDRRWSRKRLADQLGTLLRAAFLKPVRQEGR